MHLTPLTNPEVGLFVHERSEPPHFVCYWKTWGLCFTAITDSGTAESLLTIRNKTESPFHIKVSS